MAFEDCGLGSTMLVIFQISDANGVEEKSCFEIPKSDPASSSQMRKEHSGLVSCEIIAGNLNPEL